MRRVTTTRHSKNLVEHETFERLKAELRKEFAAPETSYKLLTATEVIERNRD